jgi:putative membrane protein
MAHTKVDSMKAGPWIALSLLAGVSVLNLAEADEPNDAQIAAIVVSANQVDVEAGEFAAGKVRSSAVKWFAQQMVRDHGEVNQQALAILKKYNVTPQENAASETLARGGRENLRNLRGLEGASLEKAYVAHEVAYHEQVVEAMDKALIPNARNAELKSLLVAVRPLFIGHLEHARRVLSSLNN